MEKHITVINPRYITGLGEDLLDTLDKDHQLAVTIEDGLLEGGCGQMVASSLGTKDIKVKNFGISKKFHRKIPINTSRCLYIFTVYILFICL